MTQHKNWQDFEKKVAELFRIKGFVPLHDVMLAGRQNDVIVKSQDEHNDSILIECKYFSKSGKVSVEQVDAFTAKVIKLRNSGDICAGYLVTNGGFTAEANGCLSGRVEGKFIVLKTYSSLLRNAIDFKPYLSHFVKRYEESEIFNKYEPLNARRIGDKRIGKCEQLLSDFVYNSSNNVLLITADYGAGKTTSCSRFCYEIAKLALDESYVGRIPCFVPLKYFNSSGSIQALIQKFLRDDVGTRNASYEAFDAMNRSGLLLVILDGFDEMARRVTQSVRDESFAALGELCSNVSKVIITGRPGYFPEEKLLHRALESLTNKTMFDLAVKDKNSIKSRRYDICKIEPLNSKQIISFLSKRLSSRSAKGTRQEALKALAKITSVYDLKELAKRPILLEMICATLDDIINKPIASAAEIYREYTNQWLDIDAQKGNFRTLISKADRLFFSVILAWHMFNESSPGRFASKDEGMHYLDLDEAIQEHFGLKELDDVDNFSSDVRTASFLKRTDEGYYSFIHNSFWEYFCACLIALVALDHQLSKKTISSTDVDEVTLNEIEERDPKIMFFLNDILNVPVSASFWASVQQIVSDIASSSPGTLEGVLKISEDELEEWISIIDSLAEGEAHASELTTLLPQVREMFDRFKDIFTSKSNFDWRLTTELRDFEELIRKQAPRATYSTKGKHILINNWFK